MGFFLFDKRVIAWLLCWVQMIRANNVAVDPYDPYSMFNICDIWLYLPGLDERTGKVVHNMGSSLPALCPPCIIVSEEIIIIFNNITVFVW